MSTPSPSAKALHAILPLISTGQAYSAHQKARTFAARYLKSHQYDTAIDVLFQSARELLKAGELGSGTDLAGFLLEAYEAKGEDVNAESTGRLRQLIALTGPSGAWRKTTTNKSIAWTAKHGPSPAGDQDLHLYVGELLFKEGAFVAAEPHLLASGKRDSARLLAEMMAQWSTAGGTPGIFALHGTIPYLLNGNILAALTFTTHIVSQLLLANPSLRAAAPLSVGTSAEIVLTTDPILNFVQLAVLTCQRAQGERNKAMREAWVRLCGTYQSRGGPLALPDVRAALNEIGQLYFSIPLPRGQAANPFGEMISSMFGGPTAAGGAKPTRRLLAPSVPSAAGLD